MPSPQPHTPTPQANNSTPRTPPPLPRTLYPGGTRSLSGIALRAFTLGTTLGTTTLLSLLLLSHSHPLWRPPAFLALLALSHFLEFYTTALANTPAATTSSFLLSNGNAYRLAHSAALLECTLTNTLVRLPGWYVAVTRHPVVVGVGVVMVVVGQGVRSVAMVQAGESFNHQVQSEWRAGHVLVTRGVYGVVRHPSYWGFFWWGVGSQVLVGNVGCGVVYACVLWRFFARRIASEERYLVGFFGEEYVRFRARTPVGIPFIA